MTKIMQAGTLVLPMFVAIPSPARAADVTLVCDYESTSGYANAFSETYHLADGTWHRTPAAYWREDKRHYRGAPGITADFDMPVRIEIDRATGDATFTVNPNATNPGTRSGHCRKFEGQQF